MMVRWTGGRVTKQKDEYQIFVINILLLFCWQLYSNNISTYVLIFQSAQMNNILLFSTSEVIVSVFWWPSALRLWRLLNRTSSMMHFNPKDITRGQFKWTLCFEHFWRFPAVKQPFSFGTTVQSPNRSAVLVGLPAAVWRRCKAPTMFKILCI